MIPEFSYAEYVWTSYVIAMCVVLWQAIVPMLKHRQLMRHIKLDQELNQELEHKEPR